MHICQNKLKRKFIQPLQVYPARVVSLEALSLQTIYTTFDNGAKHSLSEFLLGRGYE